MLNYIIGDLDNGSTKGKRTAYLIRKLIAEGLEEAGDVPPEMMEYYFKRSAAMLYWAATGERILNMPLPDGFDAKAELEQHDAPRMTLAENQAWAAVESGQEKAAIIAQSEAEFAALETSDDE